LVVESARDRPKSSLGRCPSDWGQDSPGAASDAVRGPTYLARQGWIGRTITLICRWSSNYSDCG
jgi:hypothetical protein